MFCTNCGKSISASDNFCGSCGNVLSGPAPHEPSAPANQVSQKSSPPIQPIIDVQTNATSSLESPEPKASVGIGYTIAWLILAITAVRVNGFASLIFWVAGYFVLPKLRNINPGAKFVVALLIAIVCILLGAATKEFFHDFYRALMGLPP